jgi:HAD superfamily hydrolase (TIGR01662 family)
VADGQVALVSNQGGIAWGKTTYQEVSAKMLHVCREIGLQGEHLYDYIFCPHSPGAGTPLGFACYCRKPSAWMLEYMIFWHHRTTATDTCYIGDSDTDRAAAEAAGVTFHWAWEFFGWAESFSTILEEG